MERHLHIIWTNGDPGTSKNMVMMYAANSKRNKWWDRVTVVIWGPPGELLCEDQEMRQVFEEARELGVEFSACLTCSDRMGTTEQLLGMGIEVKRWGAALTELLQEGKPVITI